MTRKSLILSAVILLITLVLDIVVFLNHQLLAGVMLFVSTCMVFFSAVLWYNRKPDDKISFRKLWLLLPIFCVGTGLLFFVSKFETVTALEPEDLLALGQLMMSRYQGALWVLGVLSTSVLVVGASLLEKEA